MKDIITRILTGLLFGGFTAYIAYLLVQGNMIVQGEYSGSNIVLLILLGLVGLYMLIVYSIYPIYVKFSKPTLFTIGIAMIFVGQYILADDPTKYVYIADISKVIGVFLLILSPTNILVSQKVITQRQEEKMEIIEI